ncbi:MAG: Hpt domain-containing protein [Thermodesulfobacteriota bacterium]
MSMNEIIQGYVEEVRTYLPTLTEGLISLKENPDQPEVLEEMHRLVHTIKGASMMVGIPGLSNIALQMEAALTDILSGKLAFSNETLQTMEFTVGRFRDYCSELLDQGVASREKVRETALAYRRLRKLPIEEDEAAITALLKGVPEIEGGGIGEPVPEEKPTGEPGEEPNTPDFDPRTDPEAPQTSASAQTEAEPLPEVRLSDIHPELLDSFFEEAKEHMEDLDRSLQILESQVTEPAPMTADQKEIVRQIRRYVHTIKGSAAVIGLPTVSAWGHTMEDFLDWLYEGASTIDPDILEVLTESGDLLAAIIADPVDPQTPKTRLLQNRFTTLIGAGAAAASGSEQPPDAAPPAPPTAPPSAEPVCREPDDAGIDLFSKQQTLRVGSDRVDELVNLLGELMIAASGFEQQMTRLTHEIAELETARKRIRELARDLEVGFEVKALGGLSQSTVAAAATAAPGPLGDFDDFDDLELDRYSELSRIIRHLNESAIEVGAGYNRLTHLHGEFDGHLNRQRVVLSELQDKMMQIRMLPMSTLTNKLRRTIREVSKILGKQIRLSIIGEEIELDRLVWDKITDPLMHLLRNAADHGIEFPQDREQAGKPATATLEISADREGNQVVIRISDDGAGLDYPVIRRKAIKAGLLNPDREITEEALAALIFKPGFSTRDAISEVSGRGVGMDVVRENIQALKGTVRVASWPGKGTRFTIRIPLTLAAVRALLFTVGNRRFALSLNEIREIIRVEPGQWIHRPRPALRIGESLIPLYSLAALLGLETEGKTGSESDSPPIVLVAAVGDRRKALKIDSLLGQQEIVIKSTGSHLRYVRGISGVTILGDGSVVPILNLPELIGEQAGLSTARPDTRFEPAETAPQSKGPLSVLVVDDSVSIRQVVSRLIEAQGWRARTANDGIDALEKLGRARPDVIVLDIEMPRMNGYEFLSALNSTSEYRDIPVVMLTSRTTGKHRERALSLGAKGFAAKPFNNEEFVDLILKLTD